MEVFVILHKPTGHFMPDRISSTSRGGWSYWEPTDPVSETRPRVFYSKRSAQNALTAWLMGCHRRETGRTWDYFGPEDYDHIVIEEPPILRRREDMEIVPMSLVLR